MVSNAVPEVPIAGQHVLHDAALQRQWRMSTRLSSVAGAIERFLGRSGFDRGPWLTVALAGGIAAWFVLDGPVQWAFASGMALIVAAVSFRLLRGETRYPRLSTALAALAIAFLLGVLVVWSRSEMVGAQPLARPVVATFDARVIENIPQPALDRVRLVVVTREPDTARPIKVRLNLKESADARGLREGAVIRLRARLMPPAPPMLPGSYDFARTAWFSGLSATGSVIGKVEILEPGSEGPGLSALKNSLSAHVRKQLGGSPGSIAAAFASGDRGAIAPEDEVAMRDSGLTHLLSISGLHVSAVIAAAYLMAMKLLALWPWLALRVRLPVVAAGVGALVGIGYTLLTGAEVPTIRSCAAAVLVLIALALGREPLSLRMVAVAAAFVLLLWPEALASPSFQMSFTAVIAIVALHSSAPVRAFLAPGEQGWIMRGARQGLMLLLTGVVIEFALMPIGLFHFHRAGVYGAFANVVAIPLTTFISMPLIALALLLDLAGIGGPAWWLAGKSLELLLALAHWTASQPGAVTRMPAMANFHFALLAVGGLWLALWRGPIRLWGLFPALLASILVLISPGPDVLVSSDGRHVGITGEGGRLLVLRDSRSSFTRENLVELAGMDGEPLPLSQWRGARCSPDFCVAALKRGGREWHLLMARSRELVAERALAAACERADIVIADRTLPRSCKPRWIKADRRMLRETGGLAIDLAGQSIRTVAEDQGQHGWWRPGR
ncbi:ComEC/Rec2 family competence protein [Tsuneonella sp. CC-YZS046]|uniref:ComEC/Rec2 family competence protein n=1 Tax=Tsuneonella sp. CC-YZS046 TaxID=3042152 RepID=UPI002D7744C8|nr:ComEC/Rec2 family competence protein [Tsuneonella sp. CC-YZS046]WRO67810.1 ComEC/Rec2 family competence protein [Tsuneonella sp. CC-YZS046]